MKLAEKSRSIFEQFFRELHSDENFQLPPIYFYARGFSQFLTEKLKIHGITIGRNIFIKPELILSADNLKIINAGLAAHEIAHVLQYRREGLIKFLFRYLQSYRRNLKGKRKWDAFSRHEAYLNIPYEIEAREIAEQFVEWKREFAAQKRKQNTEDL